MQLGGLLPALLREAEHLLGGGHLGGGAGVAIRGGAGKKRVWLPDSGELIDNELTTLHSALSIISTTSFLSITKASSKTVD